MEVIKKLFKMSAITALIFLILGIVSGNKHILVGLVSGSLISILGLYLLTEDVKSIAYSTEQKTAKRTAYLGYLKRMLIYIVYLLAIFRFFGFEYFICSVIGLLTVKFNILLIAITEKFKNLKK